MVDFDAVKVKNACVQWIREWFDHNGKNCNAVIGISGGKDSTVVAALCVEALGNDRVIGVLMPQNHQEDIEDSYAVINHLGIKHKVINIGPTVDFMLLQLYSCNDMTVSEQTKINLPPRIRMATLYAVSQSVNGRVACTDNLSESYIGYSTRWGDNVGDFCPLANLTSEEVIAVGDACGLPYELTHKVPSDGLCGKTDEDSFGFSYEVLNRYITTGICEDKDIKEKIDQMHTKNLFKLMPIPAFRYNFLW